MKKVEWDDFVTECIEYDIPLSAAKAANAVFVPKIYLKRYKAENCLI